jgi:hypothetical protein
VTEWLTKRPDFHGDVAAIGGWDVTPYIFNQPRAKFTVNGGYDALTTIPTTPELALLNKLKAETPRVWEDEPFDAIPFHTALEYMKAQKPRVIYIMLGETDDWAHEGNYKQYLDAAHRVDSYLRTIWDLAQSMPEYRGTTTLIFSPDHGRGLAPKNWRDHGEEVPDSKYIWMAFMGPDTPALGERTKIATVTQSQIAATLAVSLGEDYAADEPKAGKPIADVLKQ